MKQYTQDPYRASLPLALAAAGLGLVFTAPSTADVTNAVAERQIRTIILKGHERPGSLASQRLMVASEDDASQPHSGQLDDRGHGEDHGPGNDYGPGEEHGPGGDFGPTSMGQGARGAVPGGTTQGTSVTVPT